MVQIHLKRDDVLKTKGRIQPPFYNADLLPQQKKELLDECLSQILAKNGDDRNETT